MLGTSTAATRASSVRAGSGESETVGAPGRPLMRRAKRSVLAWPSRSVAERVMVWSPTERVSREKATAPAASGAAVDRVPSRSELQATARSGGASSPSVMVAAKRTLSPSFSTLSSTGAVRAMVGAVPMVVSMLAVQRAPPVSSTRRVRVWVPIERPVSSAERVPSAAGWSAMRVPSRSELTVTARAVAGSSASATVTATVVGRSGRPVAPSAGAVKVQLGAVLVSCTTTEIDVVAALSAVSRAVR